MTKRAERTNGPALLFAAGLLIDLAVGAVAFRASVSTWAEEAGGSASEFFEGFLEAATKDPPRVQPAAQEHADAAVDVEAPSEAALDTIDGHLATARAVCYETLGDGAPMTGSIELMFDASGQVLSHEVTGLSELVTLCVDSELAGWRIEGKGVKVRVNRPISWP